VSIDEKPLITQHFFFFTKNPFASKSLYKTFKKSFIKNASQKFASQKTCAKRKTKRRFLVQIFIEDKKVVGKAFFLRKVLRGLSKFKFKSDSVDPLICVNLRL